MKDKEYEIKTIRDLIQVAGETQDIEGLFEDLKACALMCLTLAEHPEVNKDELLDAFSYFRWKDDGIRKGYLAVKLKDDGNEDENRND